MEILEHAMEETAALHRIGLLRRDEAWMLVVPIETRAFDVVVHCGCAEVPGLHVYGVAAAAKRTERPSRMVVGDESNIQARCDQTLCRVLVELRAGEGEYGLGF